MKEFCKKYKNQMFFFGILFLTFMYVVYYLFYATYHLNSSYSIINSLYIQMERQQQIPSRWTIYFEYGQLYLPALLMILTWIFFTRGKKILFGIFITMLYLDIYFTYHFHNYFWIENHSCKYDLEGHIFMLVVITAVPIIYSFWGKRKCVWLSSNIIILLGALNKEVVELWKLLDCAHKISIETFTIMLYLPMVGVNTFLRDLKNFITYSRISTFFNFLNIKAEKVIEYVNRFYYNGEWPAKFEFLNGLWIDYYWHIRVFLLMGLIMLNLLLGYKTLTQKTH